MQWYLPRTPSQPLVISSSQTEGKDLSERWLSTTSTARGDGSYLVHKLSSLNPKNYLHSLKISLLIELLFQWLQLHCSEHERSGLHTPTPWAFFVSLLTSSCKVRCLQGGWLWQGASELHTPHRYSAWEQAFTHWLPRVALKPLFT